jgi:hypothetical protein
VTSVSRRATMLLQCTTGLLIRRLSTDGGQ